LMVGRSIVVSASKDSTLRVWHHPSGRCVHVLRGHSAPVARIFDIGEGRIVSTCSQRNEKRDHEMRVWDVRSGGCISTLTGHRGSVAGVLILRSGGMLSWTRDGEFGLWSIKNFRRRWLRRQPWTSISEVVESANDDIVCCRGNGVAFTWNLRDGTILTTSLLGRIDEDPAFAEPEILDRWAGVLSDGDMRAQWVDRHLVLRCGVRSPAVVWHSDNRGELVSVSRTGIVGVVDGNRWRFLDALDGGSVEGRPRVMR